jgi:hypothetical protein
MCVRLIYQYSWYMCRVINDNTCGSCMMGHHLIFSALWDSTWTRFPMNQSIGRGGPVSWSARSPNLNPLDLWLWGHLKDFGLFNADQWFRGITATSRQCLSRELSETRNFPTECASLWDEELKVVLKCMGTTRSIYCTDHIYIAHISAGISFWTFKWVLYPLRACNLF